MAKIKYRYNPHTCKHEPVFATGKSIARSFVTFFMVTFITALGAFVYYAQNFESLEELHLKQKNKSLKAGWSILQKRIKNAHNELTLLIDKDDHNYRVILDAEPLSPGMREAGIGGSEKLDLSIIKDFPIVVGSYQALDKVKHRLDVELQSYKALDKMLNNKIKMWASRPAIQPINNKQLERLHMTYGSRYHPIFHKYMAHKGLDFAADRGTPVYATGDGIISMAYFSGSYGNVIYLSHSHGFETRYAHLSKFAVQAGDHVKRGQVIAYVGNTGNSVSAHLHYEVLVNDQHVNPINFFQQDLSNKEYDRLIEEGSKRVDPLD